MTPVPPQYYGEAQQPPRAHSALPALAYFFVVFLLLLLLNVGATSKGNYHLVHLIYSGVFFGCFLPLGIFLLFPKENLPFFQVICVLYGIHYSLFPFYVWWTPWWHFEYLTHEHMIKPALISLGGIWIMVIGYYTRPIQLILNALPPFEIQWDENSAKRISLIFMGIGFVGLFMLKIAGEAGQITVFMSKLALIGILALILLRIRGQLGLVGFVGTLIYTVLYLGISISAGNSGPIALFMVAVVLLYIGIKRRIPWLVVILGIVILFPFMFAKYEYRDQVWDPRGEVKVEGGAEAAKNVATFASIAFKVVTGSLDAERTSFALQAISIRFDISYLFGHVVFLTPKEVDYLYGETYQDVAWKLVPRVIWPDKPNPTYGLIFGHMYHILSIDDESTSINFPQLVEMYVNFGPWGVFIGMFIMSQIYWLLTHMMNLPGSGDWLTVFAVSIFSDLFRIESNFSLVVAGIFYHVLLLYVIGFFIRVQPGKQRG